MLKINKIVFIGASKYWRYLFDPCIIF